MLDDGSTHLYSLRLQIMAIDDIIDHGKPRILPELKFKIEEIFGASHY